jgi:hypothetical protein
VFREVVAAHPGARYVGSTAYVSPNGFTRVRPCLPGETDDLGCDHGRITVRSGNGIHFDEPRSVPCADGNDGCTYTAGGHRYANAILSGLANFESLSYLGADPAVGVPADKNS